MEKCKAHNTIEKDPMVLRQIASSIRLYFVEKPSARRLDMAKVVQRLEKTSPNKMWNKVEITKCIEKIEELSEKWLIIQEGMLFLDRKKSIDHVIKLIESKVTALDSHSNPSAEVLAEIRAANPHLTKPSESKEPPKFQ